MIAGGGIRRLSGVAALTLALWGGSSAVASAAPPHGFFGVIPATDTRSEAAQMAANGVATVRVGVNWGLVEAQQGRRDWSTYDSVVGNFAASGLRVLPMLVGVPSWISPGGRPPIFTAAQRQGWKSFTSEVAARYGNGGSFWSAHPELPYEPFLDWEVWNEPNLSGDWGGRPNARQYVRLLRLTRSGLRRSDPHSRIGIGGIFPPPRPRYGVSLKTFMTRLYRVHGARSAFDALAIHPFSSRPKGVLRACREARQIMNRNHDRKAAMWITELGWSTGGLGWAKSPFRATETSQARYLGQAFRRLVRARRSLRLQLLLWHGWQDSNVSGAPWTLNMGLLRSDGSAKPSLAAYRQITLAG